MAFREAKVYSDGSHYIAIPQKEKQPQKKKNVIYSIEQEERKEEFEKAYKENNEKKQKGKKQFDLSHQFQLKLMRLDIKGRAVPELVFGRPFDIHLIPWKEIFY